MQFWNTTGSSLILKDDVKLKGLQLDAFNP